MKLTTRILVAALLLMVFTTVMAQSVNAASVSDGAVEKQSLCMLTVDGWADKCGNFGPIKLSTVQQNRKMNRCGAEALAYAKLLPANDPALPELIVKKLARCLMGPNRDSDLGGTSVGSGSHSDNTVGQ